MVEWMAGLLAVATAALKVVATAEWKVSCSVGLMAVS